MSSPVWGHNRCSSRGCHFCDGPCPGQQSQTPGRSWPGGSGALPGPAAQMACFEEWASMMTRSPPAFFPFRAASSQVSQGPAPQSGPTRICPRGPTPPGLPGTPGLGTGSPVPWQIFLFHLAVTLGCPSPGFAAFPGPEPGSWATGLPSSPAGLTSGDTGRVISFRPGAEIAQAPASSAVSPGPQICRSLPPGTLRGARKIPQQRSSTRGGGVSRGGPRPSLCLGVASCYPQAKGEGT